MVPAGAPTDAAIEQMAGLLTDGDIVVDGGNTYYRDDSRHADLLAPRGVRLVDCGTSGGIGGLADGVLPHGRWGRGRRAAATADPDRDGWAVRPWRLQFQCPVWTSSVVWRAYSPGVRPRCCSPRMSMRSVTSVRAVSTNLSAYAFALEMEEEIRPLRMETRPSVGTAGSSPAPPCRPR
jgi:NAD binding domain of 6-phosphogluconate dehydrogenase